MRHLFTSSLLVLLTCSISVSALAQDDAGSADDGDSADDAANDDAADDDDKGEMPLAEAQRRLINPPITIDGKFSVPITKIGLGGLGGAELVGMFFGAGVSVTNWFKVDATFAPQLLSPTFQYGNPEVAATFRFVDGETAEVGGRLGVSIPVNDGSPFGLFPSLPLRLHLGDMARLDTGVEASVLVPTAGGDPVVGLASARTQPTQLLRAGIPLDLVVSPIDYVWVGAKTGFGILSFEAAGDTIFMPLGFAAGGNIPISDGLILDANYTFEFPTFVLPGAPDAINADVWSMGINTSIHYTL